jgi:UDP-N-acetylmuramoyl-L-alanyl-D-glutamate--2,6-diaminopimelate ligase
MSALRPVARFERTVSDLINFLGVESASLSESERNTIFTGITADSREVQAGDLFVALTGSTFHGASYIEEVRSAGAVCVVSDEAGAALIGNRLPVVVIPTPSRWIGEIATWFYNAPFTGLGAVGITGTNGKTTTAALVGQLWEIANRECGVIGTVGIRIGRDELAASFTTPQPATLQTLVAVMRERHVKNLVMEVSSHAIDQKRIGGARFVVAAFTNLTQDHLDYHQTMENYFQAKSQLFTHEYTDLALINIDDPYGARLAESTQVQVETISRSNTSANWHYERIEQLAQRGQSLGYQVAIRGAGGILIEGRLPLLGEHNLDNALLAIAIAVTTGVDPIVIGAQMDRLMAPPGRLEPVVVGQSFVALVDYAHTPDAVAHALATARSLTTGKVIAVLGCGGDRDATKRPIMGDVLVAGSDVAIFTSDNPRSENPDAIVQEMLGSRVAGDNLIVQSDRRGAIAIAVAEATPGDVVIVLGKGHELGQEVNGVKLPFDDRIELARAIEALA